MAEINLARWYYPPGRPVEDGRIFADPSNVPPGWGVDPTPAVEGVETAPGESATVDRETYNAALAHAVELLDMLEKANARIAELEAAAPKSKKAKGSSDPAPSDPPADPDPPAADALV